MTWGSDQILFISLKSREPPAGHLPAQVLNAMLNLRAYGACPDGIKQSQATLP
jgi:uncharacterized protein YgbK (DUF1537 family)